jgi:hypothetical protein
MQGHNGQVLKSRRKAKWGGQSCLQAIFQVAPAGWKAGVQPRLAAPLLAQTALGLQPAAISLGC